VTPFARITTAGTVTIYTDPRIGNPEGITTGPDGAVWFTDYGRNAIGRATVTDPGAPSMPRNATVSSSDRSLTASWTAPRR